METVYLLIGITIVIVIGISVVFLWAVNSGQFDDLEGPAQDILFDDAEHDPGESAKLPNPSTRDPQPFLDQATDKDAGSTDSR